MPRSEYTRFPHAVLEVKLSLPEGQSAPQWVTSLIESGMLTEVGCCLVLQSLQPCLPAPGAVLESWHPLPDMVLHP